MNQVKIKKDNQSLTFKVEELSKPQEFLKETNIGTFVSCFTNKLVDKGTLPDQFVNYGSHSFLYGMYKAYSDHRPITVSPDIFWLLICQGVSSHIRFGKGREADLYPHLNTKDRIIIESGIQESPFKSLQNYTDLLVEKLNANLGDNIVKILNTKFSTTAKNENLVFKLTLLDSFKPYFEYSKEVSICGIPIITLEGTPKDWKNILNRLNKIRKYNLNWWIDRIYDIISNILETAQGNIDHSFWRDMFKIHNPEGCMGGDIFDGWLSNFYPYNRKGERNEFKNESELTFSQRVLSPPFESVCENMPSELSCFKFTHHFIDKNNDIVSKKDLECWSGFIGLEQKEGFNLKPIIGWFICEQGIDVQNRNLDNKNIEQNSRKYYNLLDFPVEILNYSKWFRLELYFSGEILIPVEFKNINIDYLKIAGEESPHIVELLNDCKGNCKVIELNGNYIKHYH